MRTPESDQRQTGSMFRLVRLQLERLTEWVKNRTTIRQKLNGFTGLSLSLLILLLLVVLVANARIQRGSSLKDEIHSLVGAIGEIRVTEKSYLQFHTKALREQMDTQFAAVEQRFEKLKDDRSLAGLADTARQYKTTFDETVAAYDERVAAGDKMAATLNAADKAVSGILDMLAATQADRQMEGKDLTLNERELQSVVKDAKILLLRMQTVQQSFLLSGDEKQLAEFDKAMKGTSGLVLDSIQQFAQTMKRADSIASAKEARRQVEAVMGQGKGVEALFKREKQEIGQLDEAGKGVIAGAEAALSDADRSLGRTRTIAFLLMAVLLLAGVSLFLAISVRLARMITEPIGQLVTAAQALSVGDLDQTIDVAGEDELGKLAAAFRAMMDSERHMATVAAAVGQGDVSSDVSPRSPKDVLAVALQNMIQAIRRLVSDASALSESAVGGDLATRADAGKHKGDFAKIIQGVDSALDALTGPMKEAGRCIDQISRGEVPAKITADYKGDFNELKGSLNRCIDAINRLIGDARMLSEGALAGKLAVRADASKHQGDFRKIVQGVNDTLDSVIGPLNMAARYVDQISKGEVPSKITDEYRGDFNEVKNSLNRCIDAVNALIADANRLAKSAVEGKLATRADASKHQGDFRKIVQGVNDTLDAVIGPLNVAARYVDQISKGAIPPKIAERYAGDFDVLKNSLNRCVDAVNALIADANMLAKSAVEGKLATRADASKHQGDFRKIVQGVNDTLDALIGPLNVAARCVDQISKGAIPPKIAEHFAGDFEVLKNNLNQCIEAVNALVHDVDELAGGAVKGNLATRAEASRHAGDFRKIVEGVNQTLDAVIAPVNEAAQVLEKLARRDLRARMHGSYQGDHAKIKHSLNATGEALHNALAHVADSVKQVSGAAGQIAGSSQTVASGASEQASAIQETSASLQSMAAMTRQSVDNAQRANTLARTAKGVAADGTTAMEQMQGAMGKIRASAEGTSQIIKDINEIAFQTNLLALNAAVEAARAGEAGRGFAVVAEEVRSLALRSKEAAMKTEELIRQSVKEAKEGAVTSKHVSEKLSEIAQSIGKVTDIVSEIAAAAKDQAMGIDQVTKAVSEMDKVTQQNAGSSEESSSAAEELSSQAEELAAMVGSFQLEQQGNGLAHEVPARPDRTARAFDGKPGPALKPNGA